MVPGDCHVAALLAMTRCFCVSPFIVPLFVIPRIAEQSVGISGKHHRRGGFHIRPCYREISCCGARRTSSVTEHHRPSPTAATRSAPLLRFFKVCLPPASMVIERFAALCNTTGGGRIAPHGRKRPRNDRGWGAGFRPSQ